MQQVYIRVTSKPDLKLTKTRSLLQRPAERLRGPTELSYSWKGDKGQRTSFLLLSLRNSTIPLLDYHSATCATSKLIIIIITKYSQCQRHEVCLPHPHGNIKAVALPANVALCQRQRYTRENLPLRNIMMPLISRKGQQMPPELPLRIRII